MRNKILAISSSDELNQKLGYKPKKDILRDTLDYLTKVISQRSKLKKWNVVIIDGLKYHFNWKDKLIIDKNAAKSVDIQWKHCEHVIKLTIGKSEIKRRVELCGKLAKYRIKPGTYNNLYSFERCLWEITWTEDLQKKMDLLKRKPYAPLYAYHVVSLDKIDESEVKRMVELHDKLAKYGVRCSYFGDFEDLWKITWTEDLQKRMDLLKWTPYAPCCVDGVVLLDKMSQEERERRVELSRFQFLA